MREERKKREKKMANEPTVFVSFLLRFTAIKRHTKIVFLFSLFPFFLSGHRKVVNGMLG